MWTEEDEKELHRLTKKKEHAEVLQRINNNIANSLVFIADNLKNGTATIHNIDRGYGGFSFSTPRGIYETTVSMALPRHGNIEIKAYGWDITGG